MSISCNLIAAAVDEGPNDIEFKCEHKELVYSIDNYSSEFEDLLLHHKERLFSGIQLDIQSAYFSDDDRCVVIPPDAVIGFPTEFEGDTSNQASGERASRAGRAGPYHRHRRLYRNESGTKTFLVVYVRDASGGKPEKNPSGFVNSLEDDVFGTFGDPVNLSSVVSGDDTFCY
jgi:hypothetical protein